MCRVAAELFWVSLFSQMWVHAHEAPNHITSMFLQLLTVEFTLNLFLTYSCLTISQHYYMQLYKQFPKLHVFTYGAAPCVDFVIADACSQFVTR